MVKARLTITTGRISPRAVGALSVLPATAIFLASLLSCTVRPARRLAGLWALLVALIVHAATHPVTGATTQW